MNISCMYGSVSVNAAFKNGINLFYDISGSGKTFLFTIVKTYCEENSIRYEAFDYLNTNKSTNSILNSCKGADIVILDNADLYITKPLLAELQKLCPCILISVKDITKIPMRGVSMCSVTYTGNKLEVTYDA